MASEPVTYDAAVIQHFADRLYREAAVIIFKAVFLGVLAGAIIGGITAVVVQQRQNLVTASVFGALLGGLVGYSRGRERAFELKLRAQEALCQVQIEKHTSILKGLVRPTKPPLQ
jgi:outer membrane lipoprotein SlyB